MKHGVFMFPTDEAVDPATLAAMAESYGFESLFFPEHSHIPASRITPFPLGGELPRRYTRTLDLFVSLTAAAAATSRLLIGSGACLVAQRDPIICAKEVASIDHLSGGRFLLGVAAGWNVEEAANHGIDPQRRFAVMREKVEAMRAIWTQEEATYRGRFVEFERIWSWPKPVQRPHPPILVGGNGPGVLERVLAWGDEWCPNPAPGVPARIAELRSRAAELGKDVPVTVYGAPTSSSEMEAHAAAGATRYVHALPSAGRDEVERTLQSILEEIEAFER